MRIKAVIAVANGGAIGRANGIPWRSRADMKHFKHETEGAAVLFGRTTWEGLPKRPLPNRLNIVLTSDPSYVTDGATVVASIEQAVRVAKEAGLNLCVCGGAKVYSQCMDLVDEAVITHVATDVPDADAFYSPDFPAWSLTEHFLLPREEGEPQCYVCRLEPLSI